MPDRVGEVPLFKGTLDVLILKALTWGPQHGYGISTWLNAQADGTFVVDDSAMYQALQRLEGRGYLSAGWSMTENNRRARFYRLTALGRRRLQADRDMWLRYTRSVSSILSLANRDA